MPKPHIPLEDIRAQVETCRACPLADGRTQTVFGVGNPEARVMIIGEAPGKNEDLQGEPFVGAAGKYLNELLAIAGLRRGESRSAPRGDRAVHPVPARADAHHRPRVHRHAGQLLYEVHFEDGDRHHAPARHGAASGQVQGVPHLPSGCCALRRQQARGPGERLRHAQRASTRERCGACAGSARRVGGEGRAGCRSRRAAEPERTPRARAAAAAVEGYFLHSELR